MQHQDLATCGLFAAFHLSPKLPPDPPSIPPFDVLPPTQLHTHVPPYRKKSQVSKRHSQPDQLTRCLPSPPLPEQAHLEQGSLFRGRVVAFVAFSPDCFLRRDLLGGFPGASASLRQLYDFVRFVFLHKDNRSSSLHPISQCNVCNDLQESKCCVFQSNIAMQLMVLHE